MTDTERNPSQSLEIPQEGFRIGFSGNYDDFFEQVRNLAKEEYKLHYLTLSKTSIGDPLLTSEETSVCGEKNSGYRELPKFQFQTILSYSKPKTPKDEPFYFSDNYVESIKQKLTSFGYSIETVKEGTTYGPESPGNSYLLGKNILIVSVGKFSYSLDFGFTNKKSIDNYLRESINNRHPILSNRELQKEYEQRIKELKSNSIIIRNTGGGEHDLRYWTLPKLTQEETFIERVGDYIRFYREFVRAIYEVECLKEPNIHISLKLPGKIAEPSDSNTTGVPVFKRCGILKEGKQSAVCSFCNSNYYTNKSLTCPHCGASEPKYPVLEE